MILRELIIRLQALDKDGYDQTEVEIEGCDCINVATGIEVGGGRILISCEEGVGFSERAARYRKGELA